MVPLASIMPWMVLNVPCLGALDDASDDSERDLLTEFERELT
jgi:hypothetical protein